MAKPAFMYLYVAAALLLGACTDPAPHGRAVTLNDAAARALYQSVCAREVHNVDGAWSCAASDDVALSSQCIALPTSALNMMYCLVHDDAHGRALFGRLRDRGNAPPAFEPWLEAFNTDAAGAPSTPCGAGASNLHRLTALKFDAAANRIIVEAAAAAPLSTALACGRLQNGDFSAGEEPFRAFAQGSERGLLRPHERLYVRVWVSFDAAAADISKTRRINVTSDALPAP